MTAGDKVITDVLIGTSEGDYGGTHDVVMVRVPHGQGCIVEHRIHRLLGLAGSAGDWTADELAARAAVEMVADACALPGLSSAAKQKEARDEA